jgi:6-phosphogluconolactonase (cycloisomerase 2 family)
MITMQSLPSRSLRVALGAATLGGFGLLTTLGTGVANAAQPAAQPAASPSASAGYVYLNDNTTGTNTIAAFARHADGSLTPLAGSPFVAGGAGTGASGLASQGALQLTSDGRFLIAVDAGSNQISVLRVENDGSLELLPGGVVSSDGALPVSVGVHDGLVYVANAGPADTNYTGFTLSPSGRLSPLADSTIPLPAASQPGDVIFNSTGANLVATRIGTSLIDTFSVGSDGLLTAAANSPIKAQAAGPFGGKFSPIDASELFVSNAHAGSGAGSVSSFSVANDGTLSSVGASPFANGQTGTCWVEITHDGQFLFSVNTGSGTISRYSIAPDGSLTHLGDTPVSQQGGVGATDARLSPDGKTLYVDESRIGEVGVFAVSGSNLTELPSSPVALPVSAGAAGVAVSS